MVTAAALSRAMHLDGLADTADGLAAGYDRERALEVMRRGDTGPAGAAALVLTLLVQVACLAALLTSAVGATLAGVALLASRLAPALCARLGVPAARRGGPRGQAVAGSCAGATAAALRRPPGGRQRPRSRGGSAARGVGRPLRRAHSRSS